MTLEQRLRDERNWAIEQGREEWVNKGRAEGLDKGRKEGLDEGRKKGLDEGRKEGLNEGRAEAYAEIIRNMAASGVSQDQIAALTGIPLSKVHSFLNQ